MPLCFHQKLRATVTRVLAQSDRRVHPSDSASSTTTRHLGYFSNRLPALEKATSSLCSRPAIILAAPLLTKGQVNTIQRHIIGLCTCRMVCGSNRKQHRSAFKSISLIYSISPNSTTAHGFHPPAKSCFLRNTSTCWSSPSQEGHCQSTQELHLLLASRPCRGFSIHQNEPKSTALASRMV